MEFGVVASCFSDYPWRSFLDQAWRLGCEAVELDSRPDAHCGTLSPDTDPEAVASDLRQFGLRAGAVVAWSDFVQDDPAALAKEVDEARGVLDLAFRRRAEVVRLAPPRPKAGMSREAMLASLQQGCRELLPYAEECGMLLCLHHEAEILRDADTIRRLIEDSGSYNLKVTLDVAELLHSLRDPEAVRRAVRALVPDTGHVLLRDARLNRDGAGITEVPVGSGECPVEQVVSELMSRNFFRPFYVAYNGPGDVAEAVKQGIDYFRDLPNRLLSEVGAL